MTEIKHSPGPWEYEPATTNHGPYVTNEYGDTVCDCYAMTEPSAFNGYTKHVVLHLNGMAGPNARLIAAAPELLEALRRALNFIENNESEFGGTLQSGDFAREAIAKATGAALTPQEQK